MFIVIDRLRQYILSRFFQLLYHHFAFSYDLVSYFVSLGLWKSWLLSAQKYLAGPNVLEIGHGPGHLLYSLSNHGFWAVGLDESWQMIQQAKLNFKKSDLEIISVNGSAQYLPFTSNLFNQVVATFPSNYITDSSSLSEINRVLVPDGSLVVIPVAWITGKMWFHRLAAWLLRITGQSPILVEEFEQTWTHLFTDSSFQVSYEYLNFESSLVFIIIARKRTQ